MLSLTVFKTTADAVAHGTTLSIPAQVIDVPMGLDHGSQMMTQAPPQPAGAKGTTHVEVNTRVEGKGTSPSQGELARSLCCQDQHIATGSGGATFLENILHLTKSLLIQHHPELGLLQLNFHFGVGYGNNLISRRVALFYFKH